MAFKIGDVIIDRAQFGYGATKAGVPLYALTQLNNFNIDITADSTDVNDARGNLVYRKYTGKKGDVTATNAFLNLAVVSTIAATDAEIATSDNAIEMPILTTLKAGETLDLSEDYVDGSVVVSGLAMVLLARNIRLLLPLKPLQRLSSVLQHMYLLHQRQGMKQSSSSSTRKRLRVVQKYLLLVTSFLKLTNCLLRHLQLIHVIRKALEPLLFTSLHSFQVQR